MRTRADSPMNPFKEEDRPTPEQEGPGCSFAVIRETFDPLPHRPALTLETPGREHRVDEARRDPWFLSNASSCPRTAWLAIAMPSTRLGWGLRWDARPRR